MTPPPVPAAAKWLGALGLVPFAAGAALHVLGLWPGAGRALAGYAAVILAFMGAIHWGLAMTQGAADDWRRLVAGVLPALLAATALLLAVRPALLILAAGFVALLLYDLNAVERGRAPLWYPRLRWPLTAGAVAALCAAATVA